MISSNKIRMGIKCNKIYPQDEKKIIIRIFAAFIVIHSFSGIGVCIYSTYKLQSINITWFLPIDVITLLIAIAFLNLIVLVVGLSSAISNTSFAWAFFHVFMFFLVLAEITVSYYTSNTKNFRNIAKKAWINSDDEDKIDLQESLSCCGFANDLDMPAYPCPNATIGCKTKLFDLTTSICYLMIGFVFVSLLFAIFLDFIGFSLCFNPDFILYDEKTDTIINYSDKSEIQQQEFFEPLFEKPHIYTESSNI